MSNYADNIANSGVCSRDSKRSNSFVGLNFALSECSNSSSSFEVNSHVSYDLFERYSPLDIAILEVIKNKSKKWKLNFLVEIINK